MPFPSQPFHPVQVDPTNDGMAAVGFDIFRSTPFKNGNNWYFALYDDSNLILEFLKSTDDQLTWTVDKTKTSVHASKLRTWSDGTKIYVVYNDTANGSAVTFVDYNMSSGVVTGPYGATGAPTVQPLGFMVRPQDGKYLILTTNIPGPLIRPTWYTYDPGGNTWAGPNNLGANASNVSSFQTARVWGTLDPVASVAHCFFEYNNTDTHRHLCYQQIAANDTLGTFHDFGTGTLNGNPVSDNAISSITDPILDGANENIILSIYDVVTSGNWVLIAGNGFVTPTWSANFIDTFLYLDVAPLIQILGSTITAVGIDNFNFSFDRIYYWSAALTATPTTGWSARSTIFRGDQVSGPWTTGALRHATIGTQAAGLFLYFGSTDPTGSFHLEYSLGSAAAGQYHLRVLTSASLSPASNNDLDWTLGGVQL